MMDVVSITRPLGMTTFSLLRADAHAFIDGSPRAMSRLGRVAVAGPKSLNRHDLAIKAASLAGRSKHSPAENSRRAMKLNFLTKNLDQPDFIPRAVAVAAIGAAAVALGLLFWRLSVFLPLAFATIVIAVAWRGAAERVGARLGIAPGLSLLAVALALVVGVVMTMMAFGGQLIRQYDEVALDVPAAMALIQRLVEEHPWGSFVEKFVLEMDYSKAAAPIAQHIGAALGSVGNALAMTLIGIIGAAYLSADPKGHLEGVLVLTPAQHREKMSSVPPPVGGLTASVDDVAILCRRHEYGLRRRGAMGVRRAGAARPCDDQRSVGLHPLFWLDDRACGRGAGGVAAWD